jgi:hypothetical protein
MKKQETSNKTWIKWRRTTIRLELALAETNVAKVNMELELENIKGEIEQGTQHRRREAAPCRPD